MNTDNGPRLIDIVVLLLFAVLLRIVETFDRDTPGWWLEEKWGLTEADFSRLAETAPAWPQGKHAYRSFRIRFGEGDDGVAKTFEAHYARIMHVFGEGRYWRWPNLKSWTDRLRLLVGDHTHKACVEWIVADLDTHRKRDSITAVRGPKSLADELS
jgi:hypothetical protein